MTKSPGTTTAPRTSKNAGRQPQTPARGPIIAALLVAVVAIAGLYWVFTSQNGPDATSGAGAESGSGPSGYKRAVGDPGPGEKAPDFTLSSSEGGTVSLSDMRGESVLLYFQEGLMCQPCFDQITDLENNADALREAGVDRVVSITSDQVDNLAQKTSDMDLSTPVLSDPDLQVIREYSANSYGMMGDSRAGHSFLLVDADGTITWRADYGGAPDYTMFLPVEALLTDLEAERTS